MNKIQYIKALKIRGIEELQKGESIFSALKGSGGDPTTEEMVKVNEMTMTYYLDLYQKEEEKNKALSKKYEDLSKINEETNNWIYALEAAGYDNWEGYDIAQDMLNENK